MIEIIIIIIVIGVVLGYFYLRFQTNLPRTVKDARMRYYERRREDDILYITKSQRDDLINIIIPKKFKSNKTINGNKFFFKSVIITIDKDLTGIDNLNSDVYYVNIIGKNRTIVNSIKKVIEQELGDNEFEKSMRDDFGW